MTVTRTTGALNVLVVIQEQNADDYTLYTDCTNGEIWINLQPLRGMERYQGQAINGRITHRATLRYYPGLTGQHRFKRKDNGRIIELLSDPLEVEHREWYEVDCCEHEPETD